MGVVISNIMTKFSLEPPHTLSREELIALVMRLTKRVDQLEEELERLKKPPATSSNSSLPPSRDQKVNVPAVASPRPRGAKPGHAKMERPLIEHPDKVIVAQVEQCTQCALDLRQVKPTQMIRRQVTELPIIKPIVIETQQLVVTCPRCSSKQLGVLPPELAEKRAFGPRLEATVTYLQHQQHLGYQRTERLMRELFGIHLSDGGQSCIIKRAALNAQPVVEALQTKVTYSTIIGSDETSARVNGRNWWEWVFVTPQAILHVIRPSRGTEVITSVMQGSQAEVWVSDCYPAQLKAPADTFQLCLAHQIRNLQQLIEVCPRLKWAGEMQALFREAIHLRKRQEHMTERGYQWRVTSIERHLDRLLKRPIVGKDAVRLRKRYRIHREHLLVFLHRLNVPWHNNDSERALRASVVHRKVIGCFRSEWGAQAYAALASVIDTAKLHDLNPFDALLKLMGEPILPLLDS